MNWYEPVTLDTFRSAVRGDGMDMDEDGLICELYMGDDMDSFYIYAPSEEENTSLEQQIRQMNHVFTDDVILRDIVREALTSYLNGSTGWMMLYLRQPTGLICILGNKRMNDKKRNVRKNGSMHAYLFYCQV